MTLRWRLPAAAFAMATAVAGGAAAQAADVPMGCDRSCYEQLMDRYVDALVAHDPSRLPFADNVKYTELGQRMDVGDGFWRTASGRGRYRQYVVDPEGGQVAFEGVMQEGRSPLLVSIRLRVQLGKITEVETVFYRKGAAPGWNDLGMDQMEKDPAVPAVYAEPAGPGRLTREELLATAAAYFAGVEHNDGKGYYPFTDDCNRRENGVSTTNATTMPAIAPGFNPMAMGCKAQFKLGWFSVVSDVHNRRFPLVDVERQVVLGYAVFDMDSPNASVTAQDGRVFPMNFGRPSSLLVAELFKIRGPAPGNIAAVEAVVGPVPYHLNAVWTEGVIRK